MPKVLEEHPAARIAKANPTNNFLINGLHRLSASDSTTSHLGGP